MPLLRMQGVSKSFGATRALRDVSLSVEAGESLALIGENGAGKSTLMKILSGAVQPDAGEFEFAGRPFAPNGPAAARRAGVAMIYQELSLAPDLSVEDNILLGREVHRGGILNRSAQRRIVQAALETLGHGDLRPETLVRDLSPGVRQLVEIARAIAADARVIVFDEPTSSLTRHDVERLFTVIDKIRARGIAVIYISHFLEEVRRVCERYTVLRDGAVAGSGSLTGVSEAQIVALMVGRSVQELFPSVPHQPGEPVLKLEHLAGRKQPRAVGFCLRRGEILGLFGLVGAGRTETLRLLFGLDRTANGVVELRGAALTGSPGRRIRLGLGLVSEDRKGEGLAQTRSLVDNITLSRLRPYSWGGWLSLSARRAAAEKFMQRLQVKASSPEVDAQALSGGNQQKVALARVLHQEAEVLLLDEPTRGIDVGTKAEIYRLMGQAAADGKAVLFVSSYLPELLAVCDRVGMMSRGRLVALKDAADWTEETALAAAIQSGDEA